MAIGSYRLHLAAAYSTVAGWIVNGGNVNGGASTVKPYLFCYHNWLQRYTMSDPALDTMGEEYPNVYTGAPMLINEETEYVTRQLEETAALPKKTVAVPVCYATTFPPGLSTMIQATNVAFGPISIGVPNTRSTFSIGPTAK